jgi:hypothetical protein
LQQAFSADIFSASAQKAASLVTGQAEFRASAFLASQDAHSFLAAGFGAAFAAQQSFLAAGFGAALASQAAQSFLAAGFGAAFASQQSFLAAGFGAAFAAQQSFLAAGLGDALPVIGQALLSLSVLQVPWSANAADVKNTHAQINTSFFMIFSLSKMLR